ncbi:hypothetical protein CIB84_005350 [Bambusicola thoracicus]|uniref:Uncharacterized protein n=1 Tax=Bambusicola thoracicus TaxID=9083 RepID=A0A2P4T3F9_BAMTH|nr:hypothetical protein CIB84_005350 [Bambusicola thoracicus]
MQRKRCSICSLFHLQGYTDLRCRCMCLFLLCL